MVVNWECAGLYLKLECACCSHFGQLCLLTASSNQIGFHGSYPPTSLLSKVPVYLGEGFGLGVVSIACEGLGP